MQPASAAKTSPGRSVAWLELHTLLVKTDGRRKILPGAREFVGSEIKLINRQAGRTILLESSNLLRIKRGKNGFDDAADQLIVKLEQLADAGVGRVRPENGATRYFD